MSTVRHRYDIVHFHAIGPGVWSPLPRYFSGAKVVQTIHGFDQERAKWGRGAQLLLNSAGWMSARIPDRTIVVSKALQDAYRDRYGRTVDFITNGTPKPVFRPAARIRDRFGLESGRYVLFVGRLVPEKAPEALVRAFANVDRDVALVVAGGSSFTDDYVEGLYDVAGRDRRVIMTGYVFGEELQELYSNAAVFVLPSYLEGLPLTLLEAASYNRSIVASAISPHLEVLGTSGPARRLVPPGDEAALTAAITQALDTADAEQRAAVELGREVRDRYSWDAATDAIEALYLELLGDRARRELPARPARGTTTWEQPAGDGEHQLVKATCAGLLDDARRRAS
jgi:glycosyltransferase involved in cell wall biosynthesis